MLKTLTVAIVEEPKISAKMLCEYSESSALTRKNILKSCKEKDSAAMAASIRYTQAQNAISDFLEHSFDFTDALRYYAKNIRIESKNLSGKKAEYAVSCAEAIDKFCEMEKQIKSLFKDFIINNTIKLKWERISISGVDISIRPEVMLYTDSGITPSGFVKLCFCKSKPMKETVAKSIAALGRFYFREKKDIDFKPVNCIVIDVFAKKIYSGNKSEKRLIDILKECCAEIADRWDKI